MDYEKVRYDRLNQVVKKAVEQTIKKSLMAEQLEKCFPTISSMDGGADALETARKQIQKYFHSTCFKQFEHIFAERDIEQKLNDLDEIIQSAQYARDSGSAVPAHVDQLSAQDLVQASLHQSKADTQRKLTMIYEQLVLDNQELFEQLQGLAAEGQKMQRDIEQQVSAVSGEVDDSACLAFEQKLRDLTGQAFTT